MKYRTIAADPPWHISGGPLAGGIGEGFVFPDGKQRSRALPYQTMSVDEIAALPVESLAEENAVLYLWTINAYVEESYRIARAWGFSPSTLLTWCKNPMGSGLGGAFGISTEFILFARRGKPSQARTVGTWFQWKRQYVNGHPSHSSKPAGFYDLVEQINDGPFLELFARPPHRLGWDVWGDQSAGTAVMSS